MIVVLVGRAEERFTVHKEIICAKSKFFKAACTERWLEGQQKTIRLPEVIPQIFQYYVDWVYTNNISKDGLPGSHQPCIRMYLLGTYLNDVKFQNKSMELIVALNDKLVNTHPGIGSAQLIWENTTPDSLLRKWFVDNIAQKVSSDFLASEYADMPTEAIHQLAVKLKQTIEHGPMAATPRIPQKASDYFEVEITD